MLNNGGQRDDGKADNIKIDKRCDRRRYAQRNG